MKQSAYDVLTCAAVIPAAGLDHNLFLKCIPNAEMVLAMIPLLKDGLLGLRGFKIILNDNLAGLDSLHEHENPTALISFLESLLNEMKACPRIEENKDYISVLHTFQNACERFCGCDEELNDKLAELSASLANLLDEPFFHFLTKEMKCDDKEYLSILCNAEETLVLKVLDRAYEAPETSKQLTLFRFCLESLQSISHAHHNWLGVNTSTEYVDNLIGLIDERIRKLEVMATLEEALAELEREFGPLNGDGE